MKLLNLVQGSAEWLAHRSNCWNASEAAMMLGVSPYLKRTELLRWRATGIAPEWDDATLRAFAEGHRAEALARPLAEKIVGDELYPCVGVIEGTKYSASFDGLTLLGETNFEHKLLNAELREAIRPDNSINAIPEHYRIQMEQQCMVSGCERVLFMASEWAGDELVEERHCWYYPDLTLRARIVAGWAQFDADVATYVAEPAAAPTPVGRAPEGLPALRIEVTGMVTASNLAEFRNHAIEVFRGIRTDLQSDQDFADAEKTVKWCGDIEDRLDAAKAHALSQTTSIEELFRAIDDIKAEARTKRLELDKLVTKRKEQIRSEIVTAGIESVRAHYAAINATLGAHAIMAPQSLSLEIGGAIKGKRTVASIKDAVDSAAANAKISASQRAEAVRASIAALAEASAGHEALFADRVALCAAKAPDDIRNLVAARIAEHRQREEAKLEQERERIRREEAARVEREQAAGKRSAEPAVTPVTGRIADVVEHGMAGVDFSPQPAKQATSSAARIKLGDINARIAPITVTADGLASLGFKSVGTERAAKLYDESDFPLICQRLQGVLSEAVARKAA